MQRLHSVQFQPRKYVLYIMDLLRVHTLHHAVHHTTSGIDLPLKDLPQELGIYHTEHQHYSSCTLCWPWRNLSGYIVSFSSNRFFGELRRFTFRLDRGVLRLVQDTGAHLLWHGCYQRTHATVPKYNDSFYINIKPKRS